MPLTNLPTRTFCLRLALQSHVHTALVQAHTVDWLQTPARPTLLGARPTKEVEAEIQTRLREASAARSAPPPRVPGQRATSSTRNEIAPPPHPTTDPLPEITPNLKNRI